MADSGSPLVIYVPGLMPKPDPRLHRDALLGCLLTGVGRVDDDVAAQIGSDDQHFEIVPWTFDFYGRYRNFEIDRTSIDALLEKTKASKEDIVEAASWKRGLTRRLYRLGDIVPFLIPHIASERMEVHLRDLMKYTLNQRGIAERVRHKLKSPLRKASEANRPVLLIGHSMGSVIAYDALWQMSRRDGDELRVDLLLTMGSPLGQAYIQRRLKGADESGVRRYPGNIRRWRNLAAIGDLTSLDPKLRNDFGPMLELGLLEELEDEDLLTWFRLDGQLNVHSEYGYLVHEATARVVSDWWRSVSQPPYSAG